MVVLLPPLSVVKYQIKFVFMSHILSVAVTDSPTILLHHRGSIHTICQHLSGNLKAWLVLFCFHALLHAFFMPWARVALFHSFARPSSFPSRLAVSIEFFNRDCITICHLAGFILPLLLWSEPAISASSNRRSSWHNALGR